MATTTTPEPTEVQAEPTMVLSGIDRSFDAVKALSDVSLEIVPGEIHALLGENGAGKSTLMAIAAGELPPDAGTISVAGFEQPHLTPRLANSLGIAIVHQHPALLEDMTIAENIRLAVSADKLLFAGTEKESMRSLLDEVGLDAHLSDRVDTLSLANKHLLEVIKALASSPQILILDEPTAPLGREAVDVLFSHVTAAAQRGTAVVYITHRLAEVRQLASRVTVLRDGKVSGAAQVDEVSDEQLFGWIVGRRLVGSTFPAKPDLSTEPEGYLSITGLDGAGFSDMSISARRGEIVGIAGVIGNGQTEFLAALAGLVSFQGTVEVDGTSLTAKELREKAAYMPADRHREGLMMSLSVRENAAVSALRRFTRGLFTRRASELIAVRSELTSLNVRVPTIQAPVTSLSGGNQQKVVAARALLSQPGMLIADEPTQGVDVGARAEIYRILRETAADGIPVVIASSDAHELEGLCDRVLRHVPRPERRRAHRPRSGRGPHRPRRRGCHHREAAPSRWQGRGAGRRRCDDSSRATTPRSWCSPSSSPLSAPTSTRPTPTTSAPSTSRRCWRSSQPSGSSRSVKPSPSWWPASTCRWDPWPGSWWSLPRSSWWTARHSASWRWDWSSWAWWRPPSGAVNGGLIRYGKFTPVAATLTTYIALGGAAFILRDRPGGLFSSTVTDAIQAKLGPVPWAFIALVVLTIGMEYALRRRQWGHRLRAIGSNEDSARRLGINVNRTAVAAYVTVSLCVFLGAIVLMAQLGIGDPAQGVGYTLSSVTAVVLGGTSLLGGRGTFIGTLLGAFLIVQVQNATVFLRLDQTWQYFFQGALIMVAAIIYSQVRGFRRTL